MDAPSATAAAGGAGRHGDVLLARPADLVRGRGAAARACARSAQAGRVVASSRAVRVEIDGVLLAESRRPLLLFETTLPVRYYLPPDDVQIELVRSQTRSVCPYKGVATWWSGRIGDRVAEDIAWSYPSPVPENPRIAGLICFRNERVDLTVDGQRLERPVTPWS